MTIAYMPVDVPKIPYSEQIYWDFYHKHKRKSKGGHWGFTRVRTTDSHGRAEGQLPVYLKYNREKNWWWEDHMVEELPDLIKFMEQLPIELTFVSILSNIWLIEPHQDLDTFEFNKLGIDEYIAEQKGLEPSSFRILLAKNQNDSFFVTPTKDIEKAINVTVPNETDTFLFNSTEFYHGAFVPKEPKLIVFVSGFIKPDEHKRLLDRSVEKYSDYIIDF